MVMLADTDAPDPVATLDHLRAGWTAATLLTEGEVKDGAAGVLVPGGMLAFVHVPVPIPSGDLEGPTTSMTPAPRHETRCPCSRGSALTQ